MLAPEFVSAEIREWIDSYPALDMQLRDVIIELSKRIIQSYEFYYREVNKE